MLTLTKRRLDVVLKVCEKVRCHPVELISKLIDIHLDPIAVKSGMPDEGVNSLHKISSSDLKTAIPRGLHKLTRSQFEVMLDMFRQGWLIEDIAKMYSLKTDDLDAFFCGKTTSDIVKLHKQIRVSLGQEKARWRQLGEH